MLYQSHLVSSTPTPVLPLAIQNLLEVRHG